LIEPGIANGRYAVLDVGPEIGVEGRVGMRLDEPRDNGLAVELPMLGIRRQEAIGPLAGVDDLVAIDDHHRIGHDRPARPIDQICT
jgi:hypothetical protein